MTNKHVAQPLGCASHSPKAGLQFYKYLIIRYLEIFSKIQQSSKVSRTYNQNLPKAQTKRLSDAKKIF
ncbi:MAG: hypothetical protein MUE85_06485 [Microscillaceae bacterium]|nr:hypothetical protein [Microscillaceae bacterium]